MSPVNIADNLQELVENEGLACRLGKAEKKRTLTHFTFKIEAKRFINYFHEIMEKN